MTSKITNIFHQNIIHKNYMYINTVVSYLKSCNANIFARAVCLFTKVFAFISDINAYNFFILKFSKQQKFAEFAFIIYSIITCFPGTGKHLYHLLLSFINT